VLLIDDGSEEATMAPMKKALEIDGAGLHWYY
jgi:hypothetical protein